MLHSQFSDALEPDFLRLVGITAKYIVYAQNNVIYVKKIQTKQNQNQLKVETNENKIQKYAHVDL